MDHRSLAAAMNDTAGVLPMDTCAPMNGLHNGQGNPTGKGGEKKGRGRPPKSAGAPKKISPAVGVKRGRGRPSKTIDSSTTVSRKLPTSKISKDEPTANDDGNKRKRGRPPKNNTLNEQINGVSKPQMPSAPVVKHQEKENVDEPVKKKRGRPFGSSPKKSVGAAAAATKKDASSGRKRGRPSGSAGVKKSAAKPKATTTADSPARKRGRPKKSIGTSVSNTHANGLALTTASYMA